MSDTSKSSELALIDQIKLLLLEFYKNHADQLKPADQHFLWLSASKLLDCFQAFKGGSSPFHFYRIGGDRDSYLISAPTIDEARSFYMEQLHKGGDFTIEVVHFDKWVRLREILYTDVQFLTDAIRDNS